MTLLNKSIKRVTASKSSSGKYRGRNLVVMLEPTATLMYYQYQGKGNSTLVSGHARKSIPSSTHPGCQCYYQGKGRPQEKAQTQSGCRLSVLSKEYKQV